MTPFALAWVISETTVLLTRGTEVNPRVMTSWDLGRVVVGVRRHDAIVRCLLVIRELNSWERVNLELSQGMTLERATELLGSEETAAKLFALGEVLDLWKLTCDKDGVRISGYKILPGGRTRP
jgi:hypothetical protein